jgi:serine/threonine protein kinase
MVFISVMYRDIKPDNIGFDVRGDIKLFDFGVAKEYDPDTRQSDGMIPNLTGDSGSPRYMDPLVALSKPYNELCDVYSFCILLWEMLQLSTPFAGFNMTTFTIKVVQGGLRPKINPKWSKSIQDMLVNGFSDIRKRNSMTNVCEILRTELNLECEYEDKPVMDSRGQLVRVGSTKSLMSAGKLQAEC